MEATNRIAAVLLCLLVAGFELSGCHDNDEAGADRQTAPGDADSGRAGAAGDAHNADKDSGVAGAGGDADKDSGVADSGGNAGQDSSVAGAGGGAGQDSGVPDAGSNAGQDGGVAGAGGGASQDGGVAGAGGGAGQDGGVAGAGGNAGQDSGVPDSGGDSGACDSEDPELGPGLWVAPNGSPSGAGTEASPLDLRTALRGDGVAQPGDTIYLAAGTYRGSFVSTLRGRSGRPIIVRARPGARVILDGETSPDPVLSIEGEWTHFVGLEITSSNASRENLGDGVYFVGPNCKVINSVVHDTAQGFSFWTPAVDSELYGNVIYNNGFVGPDRGHGHAIYTQNLNGTKRIHDNVIFFGFSFGIHAYTEGGALEGFDVRRNVWFSAGASMPGGDELKDNCLIGGLKPVDRMVVADNLGWARTPSSRGVRLGYVDHVGNGSGTVTNNLFVGQLLVISSWQSFVATGNEIYGYSPNLTPANFPDNLYASTLPSETRVFWRPNAYDPGRAHLVIYNGAGASTVPVNFGEVMAVGSSYRVLSVYDLFGAPVAAGVYAGGTVQVPMGSKAPPQPNSLPNAIVATDDPGRAFGVFVVEHTPCGDAK